MVDDFEKSYNIKPRGTTFSDYSEIERVWQNYTQIKSIYIFTSNLLSF